MTSQNEEIDVAALRFFVCLYDLRNHQEATKLLEISASKGSRLLNSLRKHFDDELFVRFGTRMAPTQRATEVLPEIVEILERIDTLAKPEVFNPKTLRRNIRIATFDAAIANFIADIIPTFTKLAPEARLDICQVRESVAQDLKQGIIDLAISPWVPAYSNLKMQPLFHNHMVVLVAKKHPLVDVYKKRGELVVTDLLHYKQVT